MEEKFVNVIIDDVTYSARVGQSILDVCKEHGIDIPTLCYLKDLNKPASCRVCVVEWINNRNKIVTSCNTEVVDGMEISTNSPRVLSARKTNLELLLSNHNKDCINCFKSGKCSLQRYSVEYDCDIEKFAGAKSTSHIDDSNPCIIRNDSKCILCGKCVAVCDKIQSIHAINKVNRGFETQVGTAYNRPMGDSPCVGCGQCTLVCPTGALTENLDIQKVEGYLADPNLKTICMVAPSVRASLGEEFGLTIGHNCEEQMVQAIHMLGFDKVYDVNVGADITIVEEANEFIHRLSNGGTLPLFTSCCPAWVNMIEKEYPEFVDNLSTCKSPNEMMGSIVRHMENNENVRIVSIMPCTAKKGEVARFGNINASLTTRELAYLINKHEIPFAKLNGQAFDNPFEEYTGAGIIFGATGGVMEAALRTAYHKLTGEVPSPLAFTAVRGTDGIKEADIKIGDTTISVCVASSLSKAKEVLELIKSGKKTYHFVEVMACPGGCVNGGGQVAVDNNTHSKAFVAKTRGEVLYAVDKKLALKLSHLNPTVLSLYDNVLTGDLPHELLHVHRDHK